MVMKANNMELFDVLPSATALRFSNGGFADAKFFRPSASGPSFNVESYPMNHVVGHFRTDSTLNVHSTGHRFKMIGINTRWIATKMINHKIVRDRTAKGDPGQTMRSNLLATDYCDAVSMNFGTQPVPTSGALIDRVVVWSNGDVREIMVTKNKLAMLASDDIGRAIRYSGYRSSATTTAHTQARRVRAGKCQCHTLIKTFTGAITLRWLSRSRELLAACRADFRGLVAIIGSCHLIASFQAMRCTVTRSAPTLPGPLLLGFYHECGNY